MQIPFFTLSLYRIPSTDDDIPSLAHAELRLILAKMLWHFDLSLVRPEEDWLSEQKVFALWDKEALDVKIDIVKR